MGSSSGWLWTWKSCISCKRLFLTTSDHCALCHGTLVVEMTMDNPNPLPQEEDGWDVGEIADAFAWLELHASLYGCKGIGEIFTKEQVVAYMRMQDLYTNNWPEYSQIRGKQ